MPEQDGKKTICYRGGSVAFRIPPLRYTSASEEEGKRLTIHFWVIANVVPPKHIRDAIFSYTKLADDKMTDDVAMMDEELRMCRFHENLGE